MSDTKQEPTVVSQEIFHGDRKKIKLNNGMELPLARLTWGIESRALRIVGGIFRAVPELAAFLTPGGVTQLSPASLITTVFPALLEKVPDQITELAALLLDKYKTAANSVKVPDTQWVYDNLDTEDLLGVLLPFAKTYSDKLAKLVATPQEPQTIEDAAKQ